MSNGNRYARWLKHEDRIIEKIDRKLNEERIRRGSTVKGVIRLSNGVVKRAA